MSVANLRNPVVLPDLPAGYELRPVRVEDAAMLIAPIWQIDARYGNGPDLPLQDFVSDLQRPGFDLALDARAIFTPDGTCVAYADITAETPFVRNFLLAATDPAHEARGLGTWLVRWGVQRLCERLADAPPDTRFAINAYPYTSNAPAIALLTNEGFVYERTYYQMGIDLDAPPAVSPLPDGITLRTFDPATDVDRLFDAYIAVFRDHFGYVERPRDDAFSRWRRMVLEHSTFDPALVTLAEEDGEVVGFSVTWHDEEEATSNGYIQHLGTVRRWRRRGLAHALLTRVFATYHARGAKGVLLGVDAASPTGALDLYEKAGMHVNHSSTAMTLVIRDGIVPAPDEE